MSEKKLVDRLFEDGLIVSKSQARRLIKQGAIKVDGEKVTDLDKNIKPESKLQVGKKKV